MKTLTSLIAALLFSALSFGQSYTTVTATLQDSSTQVWANATWTAEFSPKSGYNGSYNNRGTAITPNQTGLANGSGVFTVTLDDNLVVSPSGSGWKFTICPNASVASCISVVLTITGATQNVSIQLNAILTVPVVNASPSIARAYNDAEVSGSYGMLYINSISNTMRQCTQTTCSGSGWTAVGSGGTPGGLSGQVQFNNSGAFGGITSAGVGAVILSNSTSQLKTIIDVRDYGAIPDGSTDNAAAITAAFTAANAITIGSPTVYFGCNGASATCEYNYGGSGTPAISPTIPMVIQCDPNTLINYTGTAHAANIGASGLIQATLQAKEYRIKDCQFTGAASATQGFFLNNFNINVTFDHVRFTNFGNQTGFTVQANGNNWILNFDNVQWLDTDGTARQRVDTHLGTNVFIQMNSSIAQCTSGGSACAVSPAIVGFWLFPCCSITNSSFLGNEPILRISSEGGGGGLLFTIESSNFNTNNGSLTPCITYGDPGAAAKNIPGPAFIGNGFFCPSASNVDMAIGPETPSSSVYTMQASRWIGNFVTPTQQGTGKYFNFNVGGSNTFLLTTCNGATSFCDYSTANINETNGAKTNAWVIPYMQTNQSAGITTGGIPQVYVTSSTNYFSDADFHGVSKRYVCNDSTGSGTIQGCNTSPTFIGTGANVTPSAGDWIIYKTTTTNTGALTLNVNTNGAVAVQKNGLPLVAGDIVAGKYYPLVFDGTQWQMQSGATIATNTNCSAVGTAANPSVASCGSAQAGSFSCATNASAGTCVVNTSAVTANSEIFITQRSDTTTGTRLSVTCNATLTTVIPEITAVIPATSFTINLGTITTNPECFNYFIVN